MRVPSIGLTADERQIVREAYVLAERMLRDYRDPPPGVLAMAWQVVAAGGAMLVGFCRASRRSRP